jgi:hypothetical protein
MPMESNVTSFKRTAPRKPANLSAAAAPAAIALGVALAVAPTWTYAEIQVRGTPQAVVVEAQNATVEEILVALTDQFKVQFRSAANLDKRLTGTYEGTLAKAVTRILKGYDFLMKSGPSGLEITLLGAGKPLAVAGTRAEPKSAELAAAAVPMPTTMAGAGLPVPMATSGGPMPEIRVAQGPTPIPTPASSGAAPFPVQQIGSSGQAPTPGLPQPGGTPMPSLPAGSSAIGPSPTEIRAR